MVAAAMAVAVVAAAVVAEVAVAALAANWRARGVLGSRTRT